MGDHQPLQVAEPRTRGGRAAGLIDDGALAILLRTASAEKLLQYANVVVQRATYEEAPGARAILLEDAVLVLQAVLDRERKAP